MALAITEKDRTACDLRAVSAKCKDAKAARRMLAIAMVLEGYDRTTAAASFTNSLCIAISAYSRPATASSLKSKIRLCHHTSK
jgi:hypothetical protein